GLRRAPRRNTIDLTSPGGTYRARVGPVMRDQLPTRRGCWPHRPTSRPCTLATATPDNHIWTAWCSCRSPWSEALDLCRTMVDGVDDGDELAGKIAATDDPYVFRQPQR